MPKGKFITSEEISFEDLFQNFYSIPSYQREYVWTNHDVEGFFTDIYESFSSKKDDQKSNYFIGTMVVCPDGENCFEVIDGQQRITTTYLFLCCLKEYLIKYGQKIKTLEGQIFDSKIDEFGNENELYRLTLQYSDSQGVLLKIASDGISKISGKQTKSVENIIAAYQWIKTFLNEKFGDNFVQAKRFYAFVTQNVIIVRIETSNVNEALKVFETMNAKGVGLNAMDLLKNLVFIKSSQDQFEGLNSKWKKLIDTLYEVKEKPLRFLRYFIMARYPGKDLVREDDIYDWFVKNTKKCGIDSSPIGFVDTLTNYVDAYVNFVKGLNRDGSENRYLQNVVMLSGSARQHLLLLLACKDLEKSVFQEFCKEIENLFFCFLVSHTVTRELEQKFLDWVPKIHSITNLDQLHEFVRNQILPEKNNISKRVLLAIDEISEETMQQYRLKYILAKLSQYIDIIAFGDNKFGNLDVYLNKDVEIEHILPQYPSPEIISSFDQPDVIYSFIPKLGNLCLLEKTINASIQNKQYSEKVKGYNQSNFLLVKSLVSDLKMGKNTAFNRAVKELMKFENWDSTSITNRNSMLKRIAIKVWDIPNS